MTLRKIVFLTGTRADFGKQKSLIEESLLHCEFEVHIFVTGMHMLTRYGYTCEEVEKCGFPNVHKYINQNSADTMDSVLAKTISGFSDYITEVAPDLIVVHGDRVEAMAGALVGCLRNIRVAHIEGGEISGTVDEILRHSITKLSQIHFAANREACSRLLQLGERKDSIFEIGSPDIDVMMSTGLPTLAQVRSRYNLLFNEYSILMFHPVTTELSDLSQYAKNLVAAVKACGEDFLVIFPNNDPGSEYILDAIETLQDNSRFRIIPSMRFEYFLTALKNCRYLIGNSSAGVRETPFYGVPSINIGTRQNRRAESQTIINCSYETDAILRAIRYIEDVPTVKAPLFGNGGSAKKFVDALLAVSFWELPAQKTFVDYKELNCA